MTNRPSPNYLIKGIDHWPYCAGQGAHRVPRLKHHQLQSVIFHTDYSIVSSYTLCKKVSTERFPSIVITTKYMMRYLNIFHYVPHMNDVIVLFLISK